MAYTRVGIVTGANKGIGYAIVRQLALQYPQSALNNGALLLYLTARDVSRGEAAVQALQREDEQLRQAKALSADGGRTEIRFHQLDVADPRSVRAFRDFVREEHPDGIDFLVNNAGAAFDGFNDKVVKDTLDINYHGTLEMNEAFLPLLKRQGPASRMVNVASMSGHLDKYSPALTRRFRDDAARSVEDTTRLMAEFADAAARKREKVEGWPSAAYAVSKAGVIGFTKALAARERGAGNEALINACCPGWVVTDMTKGKGRKTPDQGAQTPVMLALGDLGGKTGEFWQDEKVIQW